MPAPRYTIDHLFFEGEITPRIVLQVERLYRQLHPDNTKQLRLEELRRYVHNNRTVVARSRAGVIIGMATLYKRIGFFGTVYEVRDVVVDKRHRRRGIARKLMEHIIDWSKQRRIEELKLTSSDKHADAHPLYQSLGFEKTGTTNKFVMSL